MQGKCKWAVLCSLCHQRTVGGQTVGEALRSDEVDHAERGRVGGTGFTAQSHAATRTPQDRLCLLLICAQTPVGEVGDIEQLSEFGFLSKVSHGVQWQESDVARACGRRAAGLEEL